jgi:hypothetical protein
MVLPCQFELNSSIKIFFVLRPIAQFSETDLEVMLLLLEVSDLLLVAVLHASHDAVRLLYSVHANSYTDSITRVIYKA